MNCTHFLVTSMLLAGAASVAAQDLTLTDGNMRHRTAALSATSHTARAADLRADALNTDHAFAAWWYFRVNGDTREFAFRDIGGTSRGLATVDHADTDFADVDGRGLFSASMDWDIYDSGPASGVLISRLTVTNISANPLTVDLFHYLDIDACGTASGDNAVGGNSSHLITDVCGTILEYRALGNDLTEVAPWPALQNKLTDTALDDLVGWSGTFGPGDYTGAFQWQNRTLQPGEAQTFTILIAVDTRANCPPINEHYGYGLPGSIGTPQISTDALPLQDNASLRSLNVILRGAPAFVPCALLSNSTSFNGPFLGLQLWVDPLPPSQVLITLTDGAGFAAWAFLVPVNPYLCGLSIYHQWFVADNSAPNGTASHSTGLKTQVGKL